MESDEYKAFCLIDTDTKIEKNNQIKEAKKQVSKKNIELITSSPCFDLWFLLHYIETTEKFTNDSLIKKVKDYCLKYEKGYNIHLELVGSINDAINRAKKLDKYHVANGVELQTVEANPSTSVYKVIEEINKS